ncbi:MAG: XdhC family protein, partial [Candidatus Eisenbacteria bacterium]|nr:XdhC family protein [Candidatus Eisenbacteria bacterium]
MDIHNEIAGHRAAGRVFAAAVIVRTAGSSPRDAGARMLVFPDGTISGTVGGGAFEKMVIDDCASLFTGPQRHLLKTYKFEEPGPGSTGMACGGEAEVFMELFARPDRLIIFGGGHVGRDLVRIAEGLDFRITVVDDRPEILAQFGARGGGVAGGGGVVGGGAGGVSGGSAGGGAAGRGVYAGIVETVLTDAEYRTGLPALDENCYVVIVTRSHPSDRTVLTRVIDQESAYLGMIGSKTKIADTWAVLKKAGVDESLFSKVHTPIGLDIGAEGPYEIALAIAAEL